MKIILLILFTLGLQAQTGIVPEQLKTSVTNVAVRPRVIVRTPTGFDFATLGPAFTVGGSSTAGYVIDAFTFKTPSLLVTLVKPTTSGNYPMPGNSAIYRNGLLMTPDVDYTLTAGEAVPKTPWLNSDTVTILQLIP